MIRESEAIDLAQRRAEHVVALVVAKTIERLMQNLEESGAAIPAQFALAKQKLARLLGSIPVELPELAKLIKFKRVGVTKAEFAALVSNAEGDWATLRAKVGSLEPKP